ncbi:MAG: hypothetical protein M8353_12475, partial [ANME-2 cluster archaeon]|nr:hypothetical protein [ANME-2 cluster archaeon]
PASLMVPHLIYLKLDRFVKGNLCEQSVIIEVINDFFCPFILPVVKFNDNISLFVIVIDPGTLMTLFTHSFHPSLFLLPGRAITDGCS